MVNLDALLEARNRHISHALSIAHGTPLHIARGEMQYLHASDGTRYLDLVNNVSHVGHCHPHVVEAGQRQMAVLNTNSRYVYPGLTEYLSRLASTLPDALSIGFMVNSGSEANELAVRLARSHTGNHDMAVIEGAYHGHTGMLIDLSPYKFRGPGGKGEPEPWVHVLPIPDAYRRPDSEFNKELRTGITEAVPVAGLLIETMLSCAGQVPLPGGYLEEAASAVREAGGLLIADEVQVGVREGWLSHVGLPGEWSRARHRSDGQANRKWPSDGSGLHDSRDRFFFRRHGVLQHVRGEPGLMRDWDGSHGRD